MVGECVGGKAGSTGEEDEVRGGEEEGGRGCRGCGAVYISIVL